MHNRQDKLAQKDIFLLRLKKAFVLWDTHRFLRRLYHTTLIYVVQREKYSEGGTSEVGASLCLHLLGLTNPCLLGLQTYREFLNAHSVSLHSSL